MPKSDPPSSSASVPDAPSRPQMADLARMAGVSTSTVSRALSGSPLVNARTRERIASLAKVLKYSVHVGAQNLRLGQNRTVAVVIPYEKESRQHLTDPFFLGMLGSLADELTERGFDMLLSRVDADHLDAAARVVESGRALGVILIGQWRHHDQLNALAERGVPIVVWGARLASQRYGTVGGDNVAGGTLATSHLIEQRRRRIAFLGDVKLPEVAQRHLGYRRAHRTAGLEASAELCLPAAFTAESARDVMTQLVASGIGFDAVFACSDLLAMTAINVLREAGRVVPDDIAVVGYDDIEIAANFHPPLTTVRQPLAEAGRALVESLLDLVHGSGPASTLLSTELIVRGSSLRARRARRTPA